MHNKRKFILFLLSLILFASGCAPAHTILGPINPPKGEIAAPLTSYNPILHGKPMLRVHSQTEIQIIYKDQAELTKIFGRPDYIFAYPEKFGGTFWYVYCGAFDSVNKSMSSDPNLKKDWRDIKDNREKREKEFGVVDFFIAKFEIGAPVKIKKLTDEQIFLILSDNAITYKKSRHRFPETNTTITTYINIHRGLTETFENGKRIHSSQFDR